MEIISYGNKKVETGRIFVLDVVKDRELDEMYVGGKIEKTDNESLDDETLYPMPSTVEEFKKKYPRIAILETAEGEILDAILMPENAELENFIKTPEFEKEMKRYL